MTRCSHEGCEKEVYFEGRGKCIFHCEKTEQNKWYRAVDGKKIWDTDLVRIFCKKIREKLKEERENIELLKHDFSYFVFPVFEEIYYHKSAVKFETLNQDSKSSYKTSLNFNFWEKDDELIFTKKINFENSVFLDVTDFRTVKFLNNANFENAKFLGEVNLYLASFLGKADYSKD